MKSWLQCLKSVALVALGLFSMLFLCFEGLVNASPQALPRARKAALRVDLCTMARLSTITLLTGKNRLALPMT